MAIRYVDSNTIMDLGEKIRFKSKVEPVCGVDIPFSIISADYELIFVDTDAERSRKLQYQRAYARCVN